MKNNLLFIGLTLFTITSCAGQENKTSVQSDKNTVTQPTPVASIKQLLWLQGEWKGIYNDAPFYEAWRKATDSVMVNFTIEIKGTDTIVKENGAIRLMQQNKDYVSTNSRWEIASLTDELIVLKNDTLKYANRISWSHTVNDHWLTVIDNPGSTIRYDLERVSGLAGVVDRFIKNSRPH